MGDPVDERESTSKECRQLRDPVYDMGPPRANRAGPWRVTRVILLDANPNEFLIDELVRSEQAQFAACATALDATKRQFG